MDGLWYIQLHSTPLLRTQGAVREVGAMKWQTVRQQDGRRRRVGCDGYDNLPYLLYLPTYLHTYRDSCGGNEFFFFPIPVRGVGFVRMYVCGYVCMYVCMWILYYTYALSTGEEGSSRFSLSATVNMPRWKPFFGEKGR